MKIFTADYLFPVTANPLKNGYLVVDEDGFILETGMCSKRNKTSLKKKFGTDPVQLKGFLCPGFINAHCHIELSHLKGKLTKKKRLASFLIELQKFRDEDENTVLRHLKSAEKEMVRNGIVAVGDISNSTISAGIKKQSPLYYHTFIEVLGVQPEIAGEIFKKGVATVEEFQKHASEHNRYISMAPHAPYTVSEELFVLIKDFNSSREQIVTIHNQECMAENEMFRSKTGTMVDMLEYFDIDLGRFNPTGKSSLQSTFNRYVQAKTQLVHNTFTSDVDIDWLKSHTCLPAGRSQSYLCLCPNANLFIEGRLPDIPMLASSGLPLTIGTDSLASNKSLSVLNEMKTISKYFPEIKLSDMIRWATLKGAEFLGFSDHLGSFDKGKKPGINLLTGLTGRNCDKCSVTVIAGA